MTGSEPSWAPNVAVIGLGKTGSETVDRIETETSTSFYTVSNRAEAETITRELEEVEFAYLTGDLKEDDVPSLVEPVLKAVPGHPALLVEGETTEKAGVLARESSFLVKYESSETNRELVAWTVADLFESMLPPTLGDLGYGDQIMLTSNRVGTIQVEHFYGGATTDVTPGTEISSDGVLYFICTGEELPRKEVERQALSIEEEHPDVSGFLWDNRVHARYRESIHFKKIVTSEATPEKREQLLRQAPAEIS